MYGGMTLSTTDVYFECGFLNSCTPKLNRIVEATPGPNISDHARHRYRHHTLPATQIHAVITHLKFALLVEIPICTPLPRTRVH